ncbi:hypothetical protein N7492_000279 [Penicillium capsulatum]|uniref:Uncharacterized protein n=1 Tax=Penicillium capsulatum TaxID=69766 RepID=A0A9W9LYK0_9EURO|nr:hypothetical protein N7492_000279 [Penicillium capsulatum]KAJ6130656.1 hypothetical protein N7512_003436 [Penicillium capsulatum]
MAKPGEKRAASASPEMGEEPPAKRTKETPSDSPNFQCTYTTIGVIPVHLRSKNVAHFMVEFLDMDQGVLGDDQLNKQGLRSNHCILKLVFQHEQLKDTAHAPAGTNGLVIDLKFAGPSGKKCSDGNLIIKTIGYNGARSKAVKVGEIPITQGRGRNKYKKVKDFLEVLDKNSLLLCGFNTEQETVVGCQYFAWCIDRDSDEAKEEISGSSSQSPESDHTYRPSSASDEQDTSTSGSGSDGSSGSSGEGSSPP